MQVALYQPEIPPNTGNIGRLCHCTKTALHIIGKPSFDLSERSVRRAGLDYWEHLHLDLHPNWEGFRSFIRDQYCVENKKKCILLFTRFAKNVYTSHPYSESDILVFGGESQGLPEKICEEIKGEDENHLLRIPVSSQCRSLNLSNAVAIVLYEALRQQNFLGLDNSYPS